MQSREGDYSGLHQSAPDWTQTFLEILSNCNFSRLNNDQMSLSAG